MAADDSFELHRGESPLLISMPHVGTIIPPAVAARLNDQALVMSDTDWHVDRLYDFAATMQVSTISARYSRYLIDLNRRTDGASLYPGQPVTEICPTTDFDNGPLYKPGHGPDTEEIQARTKTYWQPYHLALQGELQRIKNKFGYALLWDAHSIRSRVPRFFDGQLPDLNFGTADGNSCATSFADALLRVMADSTDFSHVVNGRFKGGAITRSYGLPQDNVHAIQLELSQITYMDEMAPFAFREQRAKKVRGLLEKLLAAALAWRP